MRERTVQAEIDFDTKGERFDMTTYVDSLFLDDVEDLPIEMPLHPSKNIVNGVSLQDWQETPL